jgi:hypothetical protein
MERYNKDTMEVCNYVNRLSVLVGAKNGAPAILNG